MGLTNIGGCAKMPPFAISRRGMLFVPRVDVRGRMSEVGMT